MRLSRQETFQGLSFEFPQETQKAVDDLTRRLDSEFDYIMDRLQNAWTVTRDVEAILSDVDGSRLLLVNEDGTREFLEVDFGEDTETLEKVQT